MAYPENPMNFGDVVPEAVDLDTIYRAVEEAREYDSYRTWMNLLGVVGRAAAQFLAESYMERDDLDELVRQVVEGAQTAMDAVLHAEKG